MVLRVISQGKDVNKEELLPHSEVWLKRMSQQNRLTRSDQYVRGQLHKVCIIIA